MIQLVIEIDEEVYSSMLESKYLLRTEKAIANGKPLPKGHGRLIDADNLDNLTVCLDKRGCVSRVDAPTVIEADEEEGAK